MREIKFRVWNGEKMISLNEAIDKGFVGIQRSSSSKEGLLELYFDNVYLMQSTGLKDKNGKEIYEGDIVEWKQSEGGILESNIDTNVHICKIDWFMNGWTCRLNDEHCGFTLGSSHMTIIGNIYENPEIISNI